MICTIEKFYFKIVKKEKLKDKDNNLCQKILIIIKNDKARQANGILKVSKRQDNLEAVFKISQTRFKRVKV